MTPRTLDVLSRRRVGVLLHPTSLPGPGRNGKLGPDARRFVDFLEAGGFSVWQTLPLGPTDTYGSPYALGSAFAGNLDLIDERDFGGCDAVPPGLDAIPVSESLNDAYGLFERGATDDQMRRFRAYVQRSRRWLLAYGLFHLCRGRFGTVWWEWPRPYRDRSPSELGTLFARSKAAFRSIAFGQYLFDLQWSRLKRYANDRGLRLFGDLPFYVDRDSVEVWWDRELFRLDSDGEPEAVAGVPPDYFNAEGQLWGNPLYRWDRIGETGFRWWIDRIRRQLDFFDLIRIDHFRGLESYWEVRAGSTTAREGQWRSGAGSRLLAELRSRLGGLPLVAEDLGMITDEVRRLRDRFDLPGIAVLQFAFDGSPENPHLPANHRVRSVVYTGTHDNDTTRGWFRSLDDATRRYVSAVLGCEDATVLDSMIETAYASRSQLAVIPLQDLIGVGAEGRMNTPGKAEGNWRWRFDWHDLPPEVAARARARAETHGRLSD